ncbi:hypothetical protein LTR70_008941 [Exophiala xenobiotica]|uniref:Glycosyl transferase CAP10 domain-containing protein n=1 Tax=Lithohypha guttulata TaxID=1690604 RepID=A0ABR0JZA9_9EURO|nr:hypothetical protein LTR24_008641 [Lithohypha guttulata]KAK5311225.1 hypothetical protein LTR70_008941 [Exophiala xenobiotica]
MGPIEIGKRRIYILVAACAATFLLYNLLSYSSYSNNGLRYSPTKPRPVHPPEPVIPENEDIEWDDLLPPLPEKPTVPPVDHEDRPEPTSQPPTPAARPDGHPIAALMKEADARWREYEGARSESFRQTVEKYRNKYGRHPPPGFKEWYMYARRKNVWNIDDFDHIMDDLRPFWAIEPKVMRTHAAHMWENDAHAVAGIHIRNKTIARVHNGSWRSETMEEVINLFVEYLPDMDIMLNRLDQPRLLVPWEDLQKYLDTEYKTRAMPPQVDYNFTSGQDRLTNIGLEPGHIDESEERYDAEWFGYPGKQYMDIASKACPPESPARSNMSIAQADALYKEPSAGIVSNFNLSSDLCTVGPTIQNLHGMLYSASSITASHKLVPIFSECKVNVNNDIMFPANMYWKHDDRYDYSPDDDVSWREKSDTMIWRGVTSGGVQIDTNWQTMHRQRLVQLMNGTHMALENQSVAVLTQDTSNGGSQGFSPFADLGLPSTPPVTYHNTTFHPGVFADKISDIGFVESWGCVPNCDFYNDVFTYKPQTSLTSQFRSKYLIDVDGHSFSGRWHAFLLSKGLGFKATIFREWHDSRLFAWRHFVPVDNRYDDLYSLLTYFVGYGNPPNHDTAASDSLSRGNDDIFVPPHQEEAKRLARQGREWANKVLRRDDIEVYWFRLLLEYARVMDDNRDRIGYSGDGSELDRFDAGEAFAEGDGATAGSKWGIGGWFGGAAGPENSKPNHGVGIS